MSNTIWHNKNEKPMMHTDIILCGDGWSMPIGIVPETVNTICWENVKKWCYLDELIAQADKAERLQKAVDLAVLRLEQGKKKFGKSKMGPNKETAMLCEIAIDEIKKLIKGE